MPFTEEYKCGSTLARASMKLSTFDWNSSLQVCKTQFAIVAKANGRNRLCCTI